MSVSAAQYDKFTEQAVTEERVYTFTDGGELLVYRIAHGETVPFWSSRASLELIQRRMPKYRRWEILEIPFPEFWQRLDQLEAEGVQVGVNWSGQSLEGYNVSVAQLRESLLYWVKKKEKSGLAG